MGKNPESQDFQQTESRLTIKIGQLLKTLRRAPATKQTSNQIQKWIILIFMMDEIVVSHIMSDGRFQY